MSEKGSMPFSKFSKYTRIICSNENPYNIARGFNSLGYTSFGYYNHAPFIQALYPKLIALPCTRPCFLLSGSRSSNLVNEIKRNFKHEIKRTKPLSVVETIVVMVNNVQELDEKLGNISFQDAKLSQYIKVHKYPLAWSIIQSSGDLNTYRKSLQNKWSNTDISSIKEVFSTESLKYKKKDLVK